MVDSAGFLTGTFILLKNPKALLFGIALGSAMVFLGYIPWYMI
jgi:threonine/homoserine/homoserine lactone efflux protein